MTQCGCCIKCIRLARDHAIFYQTVLLLLCDRGTLPGLEKEQFAYDGSKEITKLIDEAGRRAGVKGTEEANFQAPPPLKSCSGSPAALGCNFAGWVC